MSKRTDLRGLSGSCETSRSLHLPTRILNVYPETLTGLSHVYCPDVSTPHFYLKAVSLGQPLRVGKTSAARGPRTGEGGRSP